jgi:two-component system, cell cycle sensor histidine kinase and response regulator CckA
MRVLLVDKEHGSVREIRSVLEASNMVVEVVDTASAALERLEVAPSIDVVVTEIELRDRTGIELLREIRAASRPVAVVVMTTEGSEERAVAALRGGADDYVIRRSGDELALPALLEASLARTRRASVRRSRRLTVLYAEDDELDSALTVQHLRGRSPQIQFDIVRDATEVLAKFPPGSRGPPSYDVLLLDYRLPGMDALELLAVLREERGLGIPVIVVTGQGDEATAAQALRLEAADYLVKRADYFDELAAALERVRDTAEHARDRAALDVSDERLWAVFEHAADLLLLMDPSGLILAINARGAALLGVEPHTVRGSSASSLVPVDEHTAFADALARISHGETVVEEATIIGRNGVRIPVEREGHRLADGSLLLLARDVRERLAASQTRARLEAELHQAQRLEALGTLAGGIAHDFNNLLAAILGHARLATLDVGAGHVALASLHAIGEAGERATNLVRQVLTFGQRGRTIRAHVSLPAVVDEVVRIFRVTSSPGIVIDVRHEPAVPAILGDATELHQAVSNLVVNARQALDEARGTITVTVALDRTTTGEPSTVSLSVSDTGAGIDDDTQARMFEPFFTTKRVGEGTGLGLAVVHGVARNHGAKLTVRSQPGGGTTISLVFPLPPPSTSDDVAREPQPAPPSSGPANVSLDRTSSALRVVLVDDDPLVLATASRLLSTEGCHVMAFERAEKALVAVRQDPEAVDVVVTDYTMPGMNGIVLAEELSRLPSSVPVVLISGYLDEEVTARACSLGVTVLEKIHLARRLIEVVRAVGRPAR